MSDALDRAYLAVALEQARKGIFSVTPNPSVGCVITRNGEVVGRGFTSPPGGPHAEVAALAQAATRARGATAYVTLEPCCFYGRTPPCTEALLDAGVRRVVIAEVDPHPEVSGEGVEMLRRAGVEVDVIDFEPARELNVGLRLRHAGHGPRVRVKVGASLDGRTAMASGESKWITGEAARADVQRLRAESCAIVTGVGTVIADDPALTVRDARFERDGVIRQPRRYVLDRRLRTPIGAQVLADNTSLVHGPDAGVHDHPHRLAWSGDFAELWRRLGEQDCNEVLVEAGATLAGAVIASGAWHELIVYQAPKVLGSTARPMLELAADTLAEAPSMTLVDATPIGDDVRLTYRPAH